MAFSTIDVTSPRGTDKVSEIDNAERLTRSWAVNCFSEISGYPTSNATKIKTWTTGGRPANPPTYLFGYNTTLSRLEYYNGSSWVQMNVDNLTRKVSSATTADSATTATKALQDGDGNVIKNTYLKGAGGVITGNISVSKSSPRFLAKATDVTRATNPQSALTIIPFAVQDSQGNWLSCVSKYINTDGSSAARLYDYDHQDGTAAYIGICHDKNGNAYTYAPTPGSTDNSTKIATTAFVNTIFNKTKDYVTAQSIGVNGYIQFNSGLVIEWGTVEQSSTVVQYNGNNYREIVIPKKLSTMYYYNYSNDSDVNNTTITFSISKVKQKTKHLQDDVGDERKKYPAFKYFMVGKV